MRDTRFESYITGSCVYHDSHCDIQLWALAVHPYQSTQPSTLCRAVKWVSTFGMSNNNKWWWCTGCRQQQSLPTNSQSKLIDLVWEFPNHCCRYQQYHNNYFISHDSLHWKRQLVSWSLTSLFSTNMAISETNWNRHPAAVMAVPVNLVYHFSLSFFLHSFWKRTSEDKWHSPLLTECR